MITPGQMDQVVTLSAPTLAIDPLGQHTGWAKQFDVAAKVEPLRGRDLFAAGAAQNPASVRVTIYYRQDIEPSWRLTWMDKTFELVGAPIDVDAHHDKIELMCKEIPK